MIHAQNALLAARAMMAPLGLETMANHAVSLLAHLGLGHVESLRVIRIG